MLWVRVTPLDGELALAFHWVVMSLILAAAQTDDAPVIGFAVCLIALLLPIVVWGIVRGGPGGGGGRGGSSCGGD